MTNHKRLRKSLNAAVLRYSTLACNTFCFALSAAIVADLSRKNAGTTDLVALPTVVESLYLRSKPP
jgi:hypothetical protein